MKKGLGQYRDFSVADEKIAYTLLPAPSASRPLNSYAITEDRQNIHVELYHQSLNETRTFTLKYRVIDAVNN